MNNIFKTSILLFSFVLIDLTGKCQQVNKKQDVINLSGKWFFQSDPDDKGLQENWFTKRLKENIFLPGSMTTNNKGDDISVNTPWTGSIVDSSWFFKPEYAKYRQPGNVKVPFWLQPTKYYAGAAWYQKTIDIPALWVRKNVQLNIERSHWETKVWIDDKLIGVQNSLSTTQAFDLAGITTGKHQLTIRIDNRVKDIRLGPNSHSISDHTQTNWNGMIGKLYLSAKPSVYIDRVELHPDIHTKNVTARVWIKNTSGKPVKASIDLLAICENLKAEKLKLQRKDLTVATDSFFFETNYSMGKTPMLWDEFHPVIYSMKARLSSGKETDEKDIQFGIKEFKTEGTQFMINGRKTFLRGTLECAIFPLTGYPPMDVASWIHIFSIAKSYGLNHFRFHSWCPPEAAFDAADRSGIYLQIECASWANQGAFIGSGTAIDQYIYDESNRIVAAYGNHPSFCMMTYGNEPSGKNYKKYLTDFVEYWKRKDGRHLYTTAAGWPVVSENDYNSTPDPRIQAWGDGLKSIINSQPPKTNYDWYSIISKWQHPTVSHEIGQWCVYPDFKEIKKYTGVLKAKNFELFQDKLNENGLGYLADSFLLASGKLQSLCYKADIEAALRTPGFGGFQLLDLHDFPGQGTALVGVLNPFWQEKGYITGKEYSRFCNAVVPLARFPKMVYNSNENLIVPVEVAQFSEKGMKNIVPVWSIKDDKGNTLFKGHLPEVTIPVCNAFLLGEIKQSLDAVTQASKLTLTVGIEQYQNTWDIFVYPSSLPDAGKDLLVTQDFNAETIEKLENGAKVLLTLKKGTIKKEKGGNVDVGFSSIFWNTAWTNAQPPQTLGVLCNSNHQALKYFPTQNYSNWQWWDAMSHSNVIMLDSVQKGLKPIVRVVDDWVTARSLGLIFECQVGKGKLLVSSIDLLTDSSQRPEARQLLYSLKRYMESKSFEPQTKIALENISSLFK